MRPLYKRGILRDPLKKNFYRLRSIVDPSFAHSLIYELKVPIDETDIFGRHVLVLHTTQELDEENL